MENLIIIVNEESTTKYTGVADEYHHGAVIFPSAMTGIRVVKKKSRVRSIYEALDFCFRFAKRMTRARDYSYPNYARRLHSFARDVTG